MLPNIARRELWRLEEFTWQGHNSFMTRTEIPKEIPFPLSLTFLTNCIIFDDFLLPFFANVDKMQGKLSISSREEGVRGKELRGNCKVSQNGFPFLRRKVARLQLQPTLHLIRFSFYKLLRIFWVRELRTNFRVSQTIMWKVDDARGMEVEVKFERKFVGELL